MNKQSNNYTILYSAIMVVVVGAVLALTYMALKPKQEENIANDKRMQILSAVHLTADDGDYKAVYDKYVTETFVVNKNGEKVDGDAFSINLANELKMQEAEIKLPVFVCTLDNGEVKYILPVYGAGLWGPIWGYVAVNNDGTTIYGAYFSHQGETPGLGAEIAKPEFQAQFEGKELYKDGEFRAIDVMKAGQKPADNTDYVNAISGGTVTSKGVEAMLKKCLTYYSAYLDQLRKENTTNQ